jgi:3-oxoacyl-[acyl-carrier protein] reductase
VAERCALVTGASGGIGSATARELAAAGWPVALCFHSNPGPAHAVAEEIDGRGGRAIAVQADLTSPHGPELALGEAARRLGPVAVLVNSAGIRSDGLCPRLDDDAWSSVLDTNLTVAFRMTRRALGPMLRARFGRIVNVSSVVGLRANPGQANYAASKAGLIALTKTVAVEVARRGVTSNALAPGLIATEMSEDVADSWLGAIPARRAGTPHEVAAAIRFLASPEAAYINGATLTIDGGLSA